MLALMKKRPRSPSPDNDVTSPLDVLKRRRKSDYFGNNPSDEPEVGSDETRSDIDMATDWPRFVERRRTRQWEKLNAPPASHSFGDQHQYHRRSTSAYPYDPIRPGSYPVPLGESRSHPEIQANNGFIDLSPAPAPRILSFPQPESSKAAMAMSSSPIRHHPPSSSPFRPGARTHRGPISSALYEHEAVEDDEYEIMDEESMRREWGAEYASQNSLLHRVVS